MPATIRSAAEPDDGAGLDAGHGISTVTSLMIVSLERETR